MNKSYPRERILECIKLFDIKQEDSLNDIKIKYIQLVKTFHPDQKSNYYSEENNLDSIQLINDSFDIVKKVFKIEGNLNKYFDTINENLKKILEEAEREAKKAQSKAEEHTKRKKSVKTINNIKDLENIIINKYGINSNKHKSFLRYRSIYRLNRFYIILLNNEDTLKIKFNKRFRNRILKPILNKYSYSSIPENLLNKFTKYDIEFPYLELSNLSKNQSLEDFLYKDSKKYFLNNIDYEEIFNNYPNKFIDIKNKLFLSSIYPFEAVGYIIWFIFTSIAVGHIINAIIENILR